MPYRNVYFRRKVWEKLSEVEHWMTYLNDLLEKELKVKGDDV